MKVSNQYLGLILLRRRKEKRYSQQYVAEKMGVTNATVHNWEQGKRQMFAYQFFDICDILDLDPDEVYKEVKSHACV